MHGRAAHRLADASASALDELGVAIVLHRLSLTLQNLEDCLILDVIIIRLFLHVGRLVQAHLVYVVGSECALPRHPVLDLLLALMRAHGATEWPMDDIDVSPHFDARLRQNARIQPVLSRLLASLTILGMMMTNDFRDHLRRLVPPPMRPLLVHGLQLLLCCVRVSVHLPVADRLLRGAKAGIEVLARRLADHRRRHGITNSSRCIINVFVVLWRMHR